MRVVTPAHPLVSLIGCVQFERLFTLLSLQTTIESDQLTASTKGYSYDEGSSLYIAKRGCVSQAWVQVQVLVLKYKIFSTVLVLVLEIFKISVLVLVLGPNRLEKIKYF